MGGSPRFGNHYGGPSSALFLLVRNIGQVIEAAHDLEVARCLVVRPFAVHIAVATHDVLRNAGQSKFGLCHLLWSENSETDELGGIIFVGVKHFLNRFIIRSR